MRDANKKSPCRESVSDGVKKVLEEVNINTTTTMAFVTRQGAVCSAEKNNVLPSGKTSALKETKKTADSGNSNRHHQNTGAMAETRGTAAVYVGAAALLAASAVQLALVVASGGIPSDAVPRAPAAESEAAAAAAAAARKAAELDWAEGEVLRLVQVSDLHLSRFAGPARADDLLSFCRFLKREVRPAAALVTGDIVDAKDQRLFGSRQVIACLSDTSKIRLAISIYSGPAPCKSSKSGSLIRKKSAGRFFLSGPCAVQHPEKWLSDNSKFYHFFKFAPRAVQTRKKSSDNSFFCNCAVLQYEEEWRLYADAVRRCAPDFAWLDVRGNHDAFNVASADDPDNFFARYSRQGAAGHHRSGV